MAVASAAGAMSGVAGGLDDLVEDMGRWHAVAQRCILVLTTEQWHWRGLAWPCHRLRLAWKGRLYGEAPAPGALLYKLIVRRHPLVIVVQLLLPAAHQIQFTVAGLGWRVSTAALSVMCDGGMALSRPG